MAPINTSRCEVCDANDAKYACPRCELRTCCLSCVQIHKKELSCSGKRDKVAYKPLNKFTNMDLQSDYTLLEEMSRRIQTYRRDPCKYYTRRGRPLPYRFSSLRRAAFSKMIHIDFLPHNFSRHKANTTYLDRGTKVIMWRVEWVFPQANNVTCTDDSLAEDVRLATVVSKYLDPAKCDEVLREHFQYYHSQGLAGVVLLLKTEFPARFFKLDLSYSLKANLCGKYIVEFPTIYVVLKDHQHVYNIVDSDDDDGESCTPRIPQLNGYIKKKPQGSTNDNFLFYHSDSEKSDGEQRRAERQPKKM